MTTATVMLAGRLVPTATVIPLVPAELLASREADLAALERLVTQLEQTVACLTAQLAEVHARLNTLDPDAATLT